MSENSLILGLSAQSALTRQLDVVAHNVANVTTPGYKAERVLFQQFMVEPDIRPGLTVLDQRDQTITLASDFATVRDASQGPIEVTQNPFDLAVQGPGFLVVESDTGPRYTRLGRLSVEIDGTLVDTNRLPLLDAANQQITVPDGASTVEIDADGTIVVDGEELAQLQIVEFEDPMSLNPLGAGLYVSNQLPDPAEETQVIQGAIEGANVSGVGAITTMIGVMRAYQGASNLVDQEDERLRSMIRRLGQSPA